MIALTAKNLKKSYFKGAQEIEVLKGVELELPQGEFLSIVGASGAGKSTLLHVLGGLDRPTSGEVLINENSLYAKNSDDIAVFRNKSVGFVFQFHHLLSEFSAKENVALPMMIDGASKTSAFERAMYLLSEMGLEGREEHKPGELSGGEQQRVAIARALINNPPVIFADEPTGNLDSKTGSDIFATLLGQKQKRNATLIVVTHNEELALTADKKMKLKDGVLNFK